jgi:hypothetical protein
MALFWVGISTHLIAKYTLQTLQTIPAYSPRKTSPRVVRILHSSGERLPSTSVAAVRPCHTRLQSMVPHPLWWHPACSQISINMAHQSPQTHLQRTLLCIELEVDLCRFLMCCMAHALANPTERLQRWALPDETPDIHYLFQQCPHSVA